MEKIAKSIYFLGFTISLLGAFFMYIQSFTWPMIWIVCLAFLNLRMFFKKSE